MDTDGDGSVVVAIHPLVVVCICDYHTRLQSMGAALSSSSSSNPRTVPVRATGILLGMQKRRLYELHHSFELKVSEDGSFDKNFADTRLSQYKEIFPSLEVMGWYAVDTRLRDTDMLRHKEIAAFAGNPLFVLVNAVEAANKSTTGLESLKNMPITVYEADTQMKHFKTLPYTFQSTDSERVAVDHVVDHATSSDGKGSDIFVQNLTVLHRSVSMLVVRMDIIKEYLEATAEGSVTFDAGLARRAAEVCRELPTMKLGDYSSELLQEADSVKIVTFLTGVTKSLFVLDEIVHKFKLAYDKRMMPLAEGHLLLLYDKKMSFRKPRAAAPE